MMEVWTGLRYGTGENSETDWQGTLAELGIAVVLSLLLGKSAIALTVLALAASIGVRLLVRQGRKPALLMALLSAGLPWALGTALGWSGDEPTMFNAPGAGLALGAAFTFLTWSVIRIGLDDARNRVGLVWAGHIIILATMVAIREPFGLATAGALLVAPCLWMSRRPDPLYGVAEGLRNSDIWWLASMLGASLAVRF